MIEVKIKALTLDPTTNTSVVILMDLDDSRALPIWIGPNEANAIISEMEKIPTPRPMTHDLLKNVIDGIHAKVVKVVVNDLKENVYYALIYISINGTEITVDSRPSDAMALAIRVNAPIFVTEKVLKKSINLSERESEETGEDIKKWIEKLRPEDFLEK